MHIHRLTVLLAVLLSLVAAACGGAGPADPTEAVVDAMDRTSSAPFAFELSMELDDAARAALGHEDPRAATFVDGTTISGAVGEERFELVVEIMGVEAFAMRHTDDAHTYLRFSLPQLMETMGAPFPREQALAGLETLPPELREAAEALLDGRWVAFVGDPDALEKPSGMMDLGPDPEELRSEARDAFGSSPGGFAERFTLIEESGSDGDIRTFTVRLRARELARAGVTFLSDAFGGLGVGMMFGTGDVESDLTEIPELVDGGEVVISDGYVERASLDVLAAARSAAPDDPDVPEGSAELVLAFSDHGVEPDVAAPDDAVELDIAELMETFMEGFMGLGGLTGGFETVPPLEPPGDEVAQEHVEALVAAQETYLAQNGAYTDSIDELLAAAQITPEVGLFYGVCLHGGGDAYVIAVAGGMGASFYDSASGEVVGSPQDVGCMPPLEQR